MTTPKPCRLLWECSECLDVVASDPTGHCDRSNVVRAFGPACEGCDVLMECVGRGHVDEKGRVVFEDEP